VKTNGKIRGQKDGKERQEAEAEAEVSPAHLIRCACCYMHIEALRCVTMLIYHLPLSLSAFWKE
jgi:hypothetical protein